MLKVQLSSDVFTVCVQHALSTEKEEIMGLLIGNVNSSATIVTIVASVILRRSDKKPDRVEISEEQLVEATVHAEELTNKVKRPLRVVGWYHSHPHITVWPSHVDLGTQSMYERMDPSFVGLIFAVFLQEQYSKAHEVQVTCFQSEGKDGNRCRKEVPLEIIRPDEDLIPVCLQTLTQLPTILNDEEDEAFSMETAGYEDSDDILTRQHNAAVRTIALGHIVEKMSRPMLEVLAARNSLAKVRISALQKHYKNLVEKLEENGLL